MYKSPLVYASSITFDGLYGKRQQAFEDRIREVKKQPLYRLWMSNAESSRVGALDAALVARTEVSWGAGLLELNRYTEYTRAIASNPRLLHGLSANYLVDARGRLEVNPSALPRVSAPPRSDFGRLRTADFPRSRPGFRGRRTRRRVLPTAAAHGVWPSRVTARTFYQIQYSAPAADTLIRIAVPFSPGWHASVDGTPASVMPVDYALSGVVVPAGQHELTMRFRPNTFLIGALLSIAATIGVVILFCIVS